MRDVNMTALLAYTKEINEITQTTRRASEDFLACPELPIVKKGEVEARNLITTVYSDLEAREAVWAIQHQLLHDQYWQLVLRAKEVSIAFGASDLPRLPDYFKVDRARTHQVIVDRVRQTYAPESVPILLLDAIRAYTEAWHIPMSLAARVAVTHLAHALPALAGRASRQRAEHGMAAGKAGTAALRMFSHEFVPRHIEQHMYLVDDSRALNALVGKTSFYGAPAIEGEPQTITLDVDDARGLMQVYPLQKMCYSPAELEIGDALARTVSMQSALVLFHLQVLQHTVEYLRSHPNLASVREALLPMTELFVLADGEQDLIRAIAPNPKLLQVVANNVLPAIASVLANDRLQITDLQPKHIATGVALAARNRVFHLQIGQFHSFDAIQQTVELGAILQRTCPAMPMLTSSLATWLPGIYQQVMNLS